MSDPAQLLRRISERSASSMTLRQGDDADWRWWRSIRSSNPFNPSTSEQSWPAAHRLTVRDRSPPIRRFGRVGDYG